MNCVKGTDLTDVEAPSKLDPIMRTGAGQLKVPMRDGYIPTPTLPVAGWECSTFGTKNSEDALTGRFLNAI